MNNLEAFGLCSLARVVTDEVIERANHTISRSELNTLCKATTNKARTDLLSTALLNLMEYGYLKKRFAPATNTVEFCASNLLVRGFEPPPGFLDSNGRSSGYADLLKSNSAVALISSEAPLAEGAAQAAIAGPIERFLAIPKSNTSSYRDKRRQAIVELVVHSKDRRVRSIQEVLLQHFTPQMVARDHDALVIQGQLSVIEVKGIAHYSLDPADPHPEPSSTVIWMWDGRGPSMLRIEVSTGKTSWVPRNANDRR